SYLVLQVCFTLFNLQGTQSNRSSSICLCISLTDLFILARSFELVKHFFDFLSDFFESDFNLKHFGSLERLAKFITFCRTCQALFLIFFRPDWIRPQHRFIQQLSSAINRLFVLDLFALLNAQIGYHDNLYLSTPIFAVFPTYPCESFSLLCVQREPTPIVSISPLFYS
ncbi:MAG: hypothetical protein MJ077_11535, partial [Oscillospiraceae bacterium]|nr:hypothetical protein [Oscillospiraceae bacterium]